MRRFSLTIFALSVLFAVVSGRKDRAEGPSANQSASANPEGLKLKETLQAAAREPSSERPGPSAASEQSATADMLVKTAALIETRPGAPGHTAQSDYVTSAPAHISASAKTGGIDPALEGMDTTDLNSAAQSELKRLGCYDAKIDGKWGPKSQSAAKAFGERAGGAWTKTPRDKFITALRNYPADFCNTECAAKTAGGQCAVAAAPTSKESGEDAEGVEESKEAEGTTDAKETEGAKASSDTSYLPPWMQDAKLTNAEPSEIAAPGAGKTLLDAAPATSKQKKRTSERRRDAERERFAQDDERPRGRNRVWLPKGWPGSD
jgi:hypothetical protein